MLVKIGSEKKKIGKLPSLNPFSSLSKTKRKSKKNLRVAHPSFYDPPFTTFVLIVGKLDTVRI